MSSDGRITAADATSLRMWEPSGAPLGEPVRLTRTVASLAFTPDHEVVVTHVDGDRKVVSPVATALVDSSDDVGFNAVDARSATYQVARFELRDDVPIVAGTTVRRLTDHELVSEIDFLPDLPNGSGQPPVVSRDGEWALAFDPDGSVPRGLVYDASGRSRVALDLVDLSTRAGMDPNDPGSLRVTAGGERLVMLGSATDGRSRLAVYSLPELQLVGDPIEMREAGGVIMELSTGDVVVGGGVPDSGSGDLGPLQIVDGELASAPRIVDGGTGLVPFHQAPGGLVLLGDNDGRVATLDPSTLELLQIAALDGPVAAGALSPDEAIAAVVTLESGVQLIDVEARRLLGTPAQGAPMSQNSTPGLRWSEDGTRLWSAHAGPLQRLVVNPEEWADLACAVAGRALDSEEWESYVGVGTPNDQLCGG